MNGFIYSFVGQRRFRVRVLVKTNHAALNEIIQIKIKKSPTKVEGEWMLDSSIHK